MSTTAWRYVLTLLTSIALIIAIGDAFDRNRFGDVGIVYRTLSPAQAMVTEVQPSSDAERAGVRAGDRIDASWVRLEWQLGPGAGQGARAGQSVSFYDERLHRTVSVTTAPIPTIFTPSRIIAHMLRIASFFFALVLFWRLPGDRAARAFAGFLLTVNFASFGNTGSFLMDARIGAVAGNICAGIAWLMLALFACWFPDRYPPGIRRRLSVLAVALACAMAAIRIWMTLAAYGLVTAPFSGSAFISLQTYVEPAVFGLIIVVALIADFRRASALDRRRLEWLTLGMALQVYANAGINFFPALFSFGGSYTVLGLILSDACNICGTLFMLYGFLRYRVLDLTFAVNRAAVFAALSGFIVALFVLVEYVVSRYVEAQSHLTGAAITLGVALAIGVSLRTVHRYVDRFADRVVFRARYLADEALRAFGRRAAFVTNEGILRERTVHALTDHARAQYAALYQLASDGDFALSACYLCEAAQRISNADPTILALKDRRSPLFADGRTSDVRAEIVFPLFVRGELTGFATCGARRGGEGYTPDDIATIEYALEHVGVQLDALKTERLERKLQAVEQLVQAQRLLGADPARVLARIAEISAGAEPLFEEVPAR